MQRRTKLATFAFAAMAAALVSFSGCNAILGDFEVVTNAPAEAGGGGSAEGAACTAGTECASGHCVDGVCCEAVCEGTCETCNLPGSAGKCMPIPDGEDPANECPTTPLAVDAGGDASGAVFEDAGDGGDDAGDAAPPDAGLLFQLPDGGVTTEDNQCAGRCNGKRACHYPGTERTCGSIVCGNIQQQGRASCDGAGHCLFGVEQCDAYSCPDGKPGCVKSCTSESDCLPTHFCDAASSSCKPKLGNGSACSSVAQCQTGFCVDNVCCNSECNGFPGATCTKPGAVGSCQCDACATGTCQLWYLDEDGDGFGDKYGTLVNQRARPGCVNGPPPAAGFVKNKDDCYDGPGNSQLAAQVRPTQTGWFPNGVYSTYSAPGQSPSHDFNCDGLIQKEVAQFPAGATCGFCRSGTFPARFCSKGTTKCTSGESAGLACGPEICKLGCTPCATITTTGFVGEVECGVTTNAVNCGSCSATGTLTGTTTPSMTQRCH